MESALIYIKQHFDETADCTKGKKKWTESLAVSISDITTLLKH